MSEQNSGSSVKPAPPANVAPAFRSVALIGLYNADQSARTLARLGEFLIRQGCALMIETATAANCGLTPFPVADYEQIGAKADLAVVLGGDGSMLSAARRLVAHRVPLVGINQGRLGFMTDIAIGNMIETMGQLLAGRFSLEDRTMLEAEVTRAGEHLVSTCGLNDVVVNKGAIGRLIEFLVHIDGEFVYDLRSDGLIVATPTGSTAYSLSSNGPILQPNVPGFALVPICPHTLSNRPITVSDKSRIEITLKRAVDARLHFDGRPECDLQEGDRVTIRRAEHAITFVHPPGYSYYAMLREKLHWSEMH
ncbi:MAG: NAD kinase [Betaproteobacteria bacterium RIFCSPLOWO2_12_FULL_63_13]|nr:MAG: NAD kinase [Betaproteobacteria bacterium RIFCSPLOWO2_02_FULL_63_19]OGA45085.1 MAG: NAD kinase [Betaproteobacteria bacterium RIFCSPLOWO2_12_FULL_63_13]